MLFECYSETIVSSVTVTKSLLFKTCHFRQIKFFDFCKNKYCLSDISFNVDRNFNSAFTLIRSGFNVFYNNKIKACLFLFDNSALCDQPYDNKSSSITDNYSVVPQLTSLLV